MPSLENIFDPDEPEKSILFYTPPVKISVKKRTYEISSCSSDEEFAVKISPKKAPRRKKQKEERLPRIFCEETGTYCIF